MQTKCKGAKQKEAREAREPKEPVHCGSPAALLGDPHREGHKLLLVAAAPINQVRMGSLLLDNLPQRLDPRSAKMLLGRPICALGIVLVFQNEKCWLEGCGF